MAWGRFRKVAARATVLAALVVAGDLGWKHQTANFATIQPGRAYRSAQMDGRRLARVIRERHIRTVLNLRGPNQDERWYRDEIATTLASGATQVDMPMASCDWMSRAQLRMLVRLLDTSEYPMLIHCQHGSERTGLGSAVVELLRPGGSLAEARGQFGLSHLFLPIGDGAVMPKHLDRYEEWLRCRGVGHDPAQFRLWVAEGYRPGFPSRDDWPYNPLPLVVITRPEGGSMWALAKDTATDRRRR